MTTVTELSKSDLEELGIDPPSDLVEAFQSDESTIVCVVWDQDGASMLDCPRDDNSGDDAWEWIEFDNGRERDEWRLENSVCANCGGDLEWDYDGDAWMHTFASCDVPAKPALAPTDILIERYEHGLVCYAPIGEASQVDRQWDVAFGVAVIRFAKPDGLGCNKEYPNEHERLVDFARGICDEYTSWCNGETYGLIRFEKIDAPHSPILIEDEWQETDSCFGFIGWKYAQEAAQSGDF